MIGQDFNQIQIGNERSLSEKITGFLPKLSIHVLLQNEFFDESPFFENICLSLIARKKHGSSTT